MEIIGIWCEQANLLINPPSQVNVVEMEALEASSSVSGWVLTLSFSLFFPQAWWWDE